MNRRNLLTGGLQTLVSALTLGALSPKGSAEPFTNDYGGNQLRSAQKIVNESGDMWRSVRDRCNGRNPVLISFSDGWVYEAEYTSRFSRAQESHWWISWRRLTTTEHVELREYFANCHPHQSVEIGQPSWPGSNYRIRAFIKNGRFPERWIHSIEGIV